MSTLGRAFVSCAKGSIRSWPRLGHLAFWGRRVLAASKPGSVHRWPAFLRDWRRFRRAGGRAAFWDLYPCLGDRSHTTPIDPYYFYEGIWAFKRIHAAQPTSHLDVGSRIQLVGMLTTFTDVTFLDIRPFELPVQRLHMRAGSLLQLPFGDGSLESVSCLNVLEHVGLGRYGDPIDVDAARRACAELQRVTAPGGRLYLSTPIGRPRVHFNAHQVFQVPEILRLLDHMQLQELSVVDRNGRYEERLEPGQIELDGPGKNDFALGLFVFVKQPL